MTAPSAAPRILTRSGNLARRQAVNKIMIALSTLAALLAVAVLAIVFLSVFKKGFAALNVDFFTKTPTTFGEPGGGIAHAFVGSLVIVGLATLMVVPVGVAVAVYIAELAPRNVASAVGLALDVLNGLPSIVIGIFIFTAYVLGHGQSAFAGSLALAIIMLPLVARSTQEVLGLVPQSLREASLALGSSKWRMVCTVLLPAAFGGIVTGTILAVARAAGETAPLLFTSALVVSTVSTDPREALQSVPLQIFQLAESPDPNDHAKAWAAALVLMTFVLVVSLVARILLARGRRKLGT
jgi:phosphate transport system permease protein